MTVAGVTWNWNSAYTPTVKMMSWITATIADAAIFHSNRIDRYSGEQDEEDDERLQRLAADLVAPRRADGADADVVDVDARVLRERGGDVLDGLVGSFVVVTVTLLAVDRDRRVRSSRSSASAFSTPACVTSTSLLAP